ncbi:MAG: 3-phosphoshikimate 1-carboxyvinyltransferase [Erysipelotrichaceae bacterium]|nr:3-phosphoshikimate 1-carboxyvinyltransferase [Erysipelotrichaceae bacterium]
MRIQISPAKAEGYLQPPASKSLSHRAVICAGLANGISRIDNAADSRDLQATLSCMEALGAKITKENGTTVIQGCDPAKLDHPAVLDAYESGSTLRFFIPLAASSAQPVTFLGQPTLLTRPMGVYADLFLRQNLKFVQSSEKIKVQGPLQAGLFELPGDISSQFISGLLLAAPLLQGGSAIAVLPPYESKSYVDLTVDMMKRFGVQVIQPTAHGYEIAPGQKYRPQSLTVEGDYSQAAFFAVWAAIRGKMTLKDMNPDSLQGDRVILNQLKQAGTHIIWKGNDVSVHAGSLKPTVLDLADCPDLGPILCVLAAYTPGTTKLIHAARLRYKECDRIAAMEEELKKWGVSITSDEDSITIQGKESWSSDKPVVMDGHNDHRIVMAMSIFTLCAESEGIIDGAQAVAKSYPNFFEDLKKLKVKVIEL